MSVNLGRLKTLVEDMNWETVQQRILIGVEDRVIVDSPSEARDIQGLEGCEAAKLEDLSLVDWADVPSNPERQVIAVALLSKVYASASRLRRLEVLLAVPVLVAADQLSPVPTACLALYSRFALPQQRQRARPVTLEAQKVSDLNQEQLRHPVAVDRWKDPVHPPRMTSLHRNHGAKECVSMELLPWHLSWS